MYKKSLKGPSQKNSWNQINQFHEKYFLNIFHWNLNFTATKWKISPKKFREIDSFHFTSFFFLAWTFIIFLAQSVIYFYYYFRGHWINLCPRNIIGNGQDLYDLFEHINDRSPYSANRSHDRKWSWKFANGRSTCELVTDSFGCTLGGLENWLYIILFLREKNLQLFFFKKDEEFENIFKKFF